MKNPIFSLCIPLLMILSGYLESAKPKEENERQMAFISSVNQEIISIYKKAEGVNPDKKSLNSVFYINTIEQCLDSPELIPGYVGRVTDMLAGTKTYTESLSVLHRLNDFPAGGYGPPLAGGLLEMAEADPQANLLSNIGVLAEDTEKGGLGLEVSEKLLQSLRQLDNKEQKLVLDLLFLLAGVNRIFDSYIDTYAMPGAFGDINISDSERMELLMEPFYVRELGDNNFKKLMNLPDRQVLAFASRLLMQGTEKILATYKTRETIDYLDLSPIYISTDLGRIGIFGSGSDTIKQNCMLSIDFGGDDLYYSGCALADGLNTPVSLVVDLAGNDKYGNTDRPVKICSSVFGLSVLIDRQGNDHYYGGNQSIAFSYGGMSMLIDEDGDDKYLCKNHGLGSAYFGYSMILDRKGKDSYESGNYSQGFGGTGGIALLQDRSGNDTYYSEGGSFCQGAAKGRWADAGDGFSTGGGYGILLDISGDDSYLASTFSQGASYYHGMGILCDLSGKDTYNALSHSQGSATHFTTAYFCDKGGNDIYNSNMEGEKLSQVTGYARDNSYSYFSDLSGDDEYHFGNKSYGVGDIEAIGSCLDISGNDRYFWHNNDIYKGSESFGNAQGITGPEMAIAQYPLVGRIKTTAGIAIDVQGEDTFRIITGNDTSQAFFTNRDSRKILDAGFISIRSDLEPGKQP
jgi:hypothetical protein